MISLAVSNYGVLRPVVSGAGSIIAAGAAIALTWRGRAKWEPSEEDVKEGPQRVGGLVAAIFIAILWFENKGSPKSHLLIFVAIIGAAICVVTLLVYSFLIAMKTFTLKRVVNGAVKEQKIIGGFKRTANTKTELKKHGNLTMQDLFAGTAYDADKVWTPRSRAVAKVIFVACYLVLTVSGTVALAGAAMLISLSSVDFITIGISGRYTYHDRSILTKAVHSSSAGSVDSAFRLAHSLSLHEIFPFVTSVNLIQEMVRI